jgi:hypothetical protein
MRGGRSVLVEFSVLRHPPTTNRGTLRLGANGTSQLQFVQLNIEVVGATEPVHYQWFWTDDPDYVPGVDDEAVAIPGTNQMFYFPPNTEAHTERYFFCRITDGTGKEIYTNLSGRHTVLGPLTHPSTTPVITSLTVGTNVLSVMHEGGLPPFTYEWYFTINNTGVGGAAGPTGNIRLCREANSNPTYHPIIPVPGFTYTYFAWIRDAAGVVVRTNQSGVHSVGAAVTNVNQWVGSGERVAAGIVGPRHQGHAATPGQAILAPGLYRLEAWGASGGRSYQGTTTGAHAIQANSQWGGYTQVYYRVPEGPPQTVYIVAGGSGTSSWSEGVTVANQLFNQILGGGNGGGRGGTGSNTYTRSGAGSGGGASHISLAEGQLSVASVRDNILIAAGGGGGAAWNNAGRGGGLSGIGSAANGGVAGSQTAGGSRSLTGTAVTFHIATDGSAGQGGNGNVGAAGTAATSYRGAGGGGGGGWFGGGGGSGVNTSGSGGGGSGHIRPSLVHIANTIHQDVPGSITTAINTSGGSGAMNAAVAVQPGAGGVVANTTVPVSPAGQGTTTDVVGGAVRILRVQ